MLCEKGVHAFKRKPNTVKPVFRDHPREVIKVVTYSRWFLNAGSIRLIKKGVLYQISGLLQKWIS